MNTIHSIKNNILYFFVSLPLVIILYEFVMTATIQSKGYAYLFAGQILLVPLVCLLLSFIFDSTIKFPITSFAILIASIGLIIAYIVLYYKDTQKFLS